MPDAGHVAHTFDLSKLTEKYEKVNNKKKESWYGVCQMNNNIQSSVFVPY